MLVPMLQMFGFVALMTVLWIVALLAVRRWIGRLSDDDLV